MIRYLILALPRTGSSTLQRVFAELRGIPFIREPFNRDERSHPPSIRAVTSLSERLRILAAPGSVHGVKHVHDPLHWELGKPEAWDLLQSLCALPDCRIVFLYRQNILRQFLSMEIAHQTRNWGVTNEASVPAHAGEVRQGGSSPWSEERIEEALELLKQTTERISLVLTQSGAQFLAFDYENLFGADAINRIAEHFGVTLFAEEDPALAAILAQGERQAALSALYRDTDPLRRLEELFGTRFGDT